MVQVESHCGQKQSNNVACGCGGDGGGGGNKTFAMQSCWLQSPALTADELAQADKPAFSLQCNT